MGYKLKPCKTVLKRFKFSKTGKVKVHGAYHSHLMSARSPERRRKSRRPSVISETLAGNLRRMVNLSGRNPNKTRHERERTARQRQAAQTAAAGSAQ
jgi:large subunit ribosomal protein L35